MDAHTIEVLLAGGAGLGVVVWRLHKIGTALLAPVEVLAAVAVVVFVGSLVGLRERATPGPGEVSL